MVRTVINILFWTHFVASAFMYYSPRTKIKVQTDQFIITPARRRDGRCSTFLQETKRSRRSPKTVMDRTQQETLDLVRDIVTLTVEAGPRAGFIRTLQAFNAVSTTVQDFLPISQAKQEFSTHVALRKLFERLGATYIKLGQFIASSPTLFPSEYVLEFQKCLDATEPLPWSSIKEVIESELGQGILALVLRRVPIGPISKTFAYVDEQPLASASIAQVHVARLKTGEEVVIKVQKPGIDESLKADLSFIYIAARVFEFIQPDFERTSLSAIAGDIRTSMLEELDFKKEANNLEEFRAFLRDNSLGSVATAPSVYRKYTTKKVLVMERLKGSSLIDVNSIAKITNNPEATVITALNVWTSSVLNMPWFHADVHAGNLLILDDGRVGFIDFGIVGKISSETFNAVSELSTALAAGDYIGMAQALCNMGAADEKVDVVQFGKDIERVLNNIATVQPDVSFVSSGRNGGMQASLALDDQEITKVLLDIVEVTEANGLKLPRAFGLLVKQSLYFDRYLKILAPSLDVMADDRVYLGRMSSTARDDARSTEKEVGVSIVIDA